MLTNTPIVNGFASSWKITSSQTTLAGETFTLEDNWCQGSWSWKISKCIFSILKDDDSTLSLLELHSFSSLLTQFVFLGLWHLSLDLNLDLYVSEFQKFLSNWPQAPPTMPKAYWVPHCHDPGLMAAWQSQRTPPFFSSYSLGIILQTMSYISSPPLLVSSPCHYLHLSLDCCNSPRQPSCLQSALLQCILHVTEWSCGNTAMTLLLHLKCIGSSDKDKILPFSSKSSKILTFNSAKSNPQEIWNLGAVNLWETRNPAPEFRRGIAKWLLPHASMPFLV